MIFLCSSALFAGETTLSWDAPSTNTDGTPLTDLAGYIIHYGTATGDYSQSIDTGNVTTYQVTNLTDGITYYFTVTAYDTYLNESDYSNEISKKAGRHLSAGMYHSCILIADDNVECYGDNFYGQSEDYLGGDAIGMAAGHSHTCILTSDGNVDCYGDNTFGQSEDYLIGDAVGLTAGYSHTCVFNSDGNVDCYGDNTFGQSEDYFGGGSGCAASIPRTVRTHYLTLQEAYDNALTNEIIQAKNITINENIYIDYDIDVFFSGWVQQQLFFYYWGDKYKWRYDNKRWNTNHPERNNGNTVA